VTDSVDLVEMREDLRGQNLSFTEIAKLVGENWQALDRSEKEPYETQAQDLKERYNRDMSEYKKTPDYKRYCDYLADFRKRQASHGLCPCPGHPVWPTTHDLYS
jgi:hypothetical protein